MASTQLATKKANFDICARNCGKSAVKYFTRKPLFVKLSTIICSRLYQETFSRAGIRVLKTYDDLQNYALFTKLLKNSIQNIYLMLIPSKNNSYQTKNGQNLGISHNKLEIDTRNSLPYLVFKKNILNFTRSCNDSV